MKDRFKFRGRTLWGVIACKKFNKGGEEMNYAIAVLQHEITRLKTYDNEPKSDNLNKIIAELEQAIKEVKR